MIRKFDLVNKDEWKQGPWLTEADALYWIHPTFFYPCMAKRSYVGTWSGFVALDSHHPLYFVDSYNEAYKYIEIHNGVTFCDFLPQDALTFAPAQRWWFVGFSCNGPYDFVPFSEGRRPSKAKQLKGKTSDAPIYRNEEYIIAEVENMANQLANFDARVLPLCQNQ